MNIGYVRGKKINQQIDLVEEYGIEELYSDDNEQASFIDFPESEFQQMLDNSEAGDCLVIAFWEVISREYQRLINYLYEIENLELDLVVLTAPELTVEDWILVLSWAEKNDRMIHPRVFKIKNNGKKNAKGYSVFSKNKEARELYKGVIRQLLGKNKLKKIAHQEGLPIETVYSIQQEFKRMKTALVLAICFLLAIATIKISEGFSDNIFIQIGICIVTTLLILYNVLSDSDENFF